MQNPEKILIAGCGDVGVRLAARLKRRGIEVWGLRRHAPNEGHEGMHWLEGDLCAPDGLPKLPPGITRLAYLPGPGKRDPAIYRALFVDGLARVLSALDPSALRRTVFVSSTAVHGGHDGQWIDETAEPAPQGFNGKILLEAERWLGRQEGSHVVLRLAGIYGPGRLQLVERIRNGTASTPRNPAHWANRIHADDAAAALDHLLFLDEPEECYLGCDDTPLPLHELHAYLAGLIGVAAPPEGPAPTGVGSKRLSNARLRASGFVPSWPDSREGYRALLGVTAPAAGVKKQKNTATG